MSIKLPHFSIPRSTMQLRGSLLSLPLMMMPVAVLTNPFVPLLGSDQAAIADTIIFHDNFDPPGDPAPTHTRGAGSRGQGQCTADETIVRPLMPTRNYGLTLEAHPAILVQMSQSTAQQAILTFQDSQGQLHSRAFLPIVAPSETTKLVSFQSPVDAPALTAGKNYRWTLTIVCGDRVQPDDPVFTGWVQRVARTANLDRRLQSQTPLQRAQWYSDRGYWYDLLSTLVQAGYAETEVWRSLITTAATGEVTTSGAPPHQ
jgi:Domain of Unknown Function (DUF928)